MFCFIYFLVLLVSSCCCLDVIDFNNLQDLEGEEFEPQAREGAKCPSPC
jgi:hypothetical protein